MLFDAKAQGTILFIGYKKSHQPAGIYFTSIASAKQLANRNFEFKRRPDTKISTIAIKESHHDLLSDDIALLYKVRQQVQDLKHYATSRPGIVTAANNFFIVNEEQVEKYDLQGFSRPIIQKGSFVNGKVEFTQADFDRLRQEGFPTYVLDFNGKPSPQSENTLSYLAAGQQQQIDERYKCSKRERWYDIPNISGPGEALFFKRCHHYPKLLKNTASVLVTDSAYKVAVDEKYDLDSFVFSFYNSLTLTFAELEGRHYAGGVLELTPSEFKSLPLVYTPRSPQQFANYAERFRNKKNIAEILDANDQVMLYTIAGMDSDIVEAIRRIRQQLLSKRFRL